MSSSNINKLLTQIKKLKSFEPSIEVNNIFSELVSCALNAENNLDISTEDIKFIQESASRAEYELEKYWSKNIVNGNNKIENFTYYDNYVKLTKIEWGSLMSCTYHKKHNVLFIGSGPLPLTGVILARDYGCDVTLIDISEEAVELSTNIIHKLGLEKRIKVIKSDALLFDGYHKYDVICLAALAGLEAGTKKKIIQRIKDESSDNVHLLVRSSFGNREILYKSIVKDDVRGFKLELEVRPHNDVVNSVLILNK